MDSDSSYPIYLPDPQEDADLFAPILYSPKSFEFSPKSFWVDSTPESIDWECKERAAQLQALTIIHHRHINCCQIPILEYPWSDALYPSLVKIWGIDRFDENATLYLDQVWLERWHPDRPQEWVVIAATTDEKPLTVTQRDDGTWVQEGTRAYLDEMLARIRDCSDQGARHLAEILTSALNTYQLRYRNLHSVYDPQTGELWVKWLYEFPIYPTNADATESKGI
jgi:hypothetical protein